MASLGSQGDRGHHHERLMGFSNTTLVDTSAIELKLNSATNHYLQSISLPKDLNLYHQVRLHNQV